MKEQIKTECKAVIQEIYWERIFLHLVMKASCSEKMVFALQNLSTHTIIPLEVDKRDGDIYYFCINITAVDVRSFLENGDWTVVYYQPEDNSPTSCYIDVRLGYRLDGLDKVFRYGESEFAYTVNFETFSDDQINLQLRIRSYFMKKNDKWRRRESLFKPNGNKAKKYIAHAMTLLGILGINAWYHFFGLFRSRKVLNLFLMNETSGLNAGNLEAVDKRLRERGIDKEIRISHSFRQAVGKKASVWSWVKLITRIAMQDVIILDNFAPIFGILKLREDVELIQVWHAGGGFKAVGYCRFGKEGSPYPGCSCHKAYTMALTGSEQLVKVFEEVFGIEKEAIFPVGMPRLDGYLDENKIGKFRKGFYEKYPQFADKKIILFAPTYRGKGQRTAYYDYDKIDLTQIYDVCGEEYVFLIKMHPFIMEPVLIPEEYKDRIFDFSDFSSINDLFYVTEVLITDYSSNYYEFSLMKKPMLFYTYDRHIYELTRGVYHGVKESAPGKVCDTFEELIEALKNKDYEYDKALTFVEENFGNASGMATDKLIDQVLYRKQKV